ncbi:hypothetical protein P7K49_025722 [Saguinus oedipus]|uniref:Uncharacterized protein n=1 Tax=Saguinus oedipus TaxID=9490 RepID=A0ABQ9UHZ6_SAGOE|nr:hypothetical protein P7K49_025722 [Saguinus oedipus]
MAKQKKKKDDVSTVVMQTLEMCLQGMPNGEISFHLGLHRSLTDSKQNGSRSREEGQTWCSVTRHERSCMLTIGKRFEHMMGDGSIQDRLDKESPVSSEDYGSLEGCPYCCYLCQHTQGRSSSN